MTDRFLQLLNGNFAQTKVYLYTLLVFPNTIIIGYLCIAVQKILSFHILIYDEKFKK